MQLVTVNQKTVFLNYIGHVEITSSLEIVAIIKVFSDHHFFPGHTFNQSFFMCIAGIERLLRDGKAGWMMGASNEVLRQLVGKTSLLGLGAVDLW